MSITTNLTESMADSLEKRVIRSWKAPIALAIIDVLALVLFVIASRPGEVSFRFSEAGDAIQLPNWTASAAGIGVGTLILMVLITGLVTYFSARPEVLPARRRGFIVGVLVGVFAVAFVTGFLAWAAADHTVPINGLLLGTISLSVPLVFGGMGGVISERVGVVNVAIEGQLLAGAFSAAVAATITGSPWAGLVAAMIAGMLVSFVLAAFAIKYLVEQVIVGVVLNVLVLGITSFLYTALLVKNTPELNTPPQFAKISIPFLSEIPVIGTVLFRQSVLVYVMYVVVILVAYALFKTKWGLRLRAVGEHPKAADTVGINVTRTRFWNVSLAGAIAGMGGAYYTLVSVNQFTQNMVAGAGFIALAAVIFGRWDPVKVVLAGLLFSFAQNLRIQLEAIGSPVPTEFMQMLPYVVTILAVAGFVGKSTGPAATGKPYIKG